MISIILPVYNGEKYLSSCITSIINQEFRHFELIIVNDGSVDNSESVIGKFQDSRIKYLNKSHSGLADSLNYAISKSEFELICRIDQDDLMRFDRLTKQFAYLNNNVSKFAVCTFARVIDSNSKIIGQLKPAINENWRQFQINFENMFIHSGVMFRKSVFEQLGRYTTDINLQPPEDYELWSRALRTYPFSIGIIPEFLTFYRVTANSMSKSHSRIRINSINISNRNVEILAGLSLQTTETLNLFISNIHTKDKVKFIFNLKDLYFSMTILWSSFNGVLRVFNKIRIVLFLLKYAILKPFLSTFLSAFSVGMRY